MRLSHPLTSVWSLILMCTIHVHSYTVLLFHCFQRPQVPAPLQLPPIKDTAYIVGIYVGNKLESWKPLVSKIPSDDHFLWFDSLLDQNSFWRDKRQIWPWEASKCKMLHHLYNSVKFKKYFCVFCVTLKKNHYIIIVLFLLQSQVSSLTHKACKG